MECVDEVLCVLICIDIWEEGSCVSRWSAKMEYYMCWYALTRERKEPCVSWWSAKTGYCVLTCIGMWEEGVMRKPLADEDRKNWITELKFWCVVFGNKVWMKVYENTKLYEFKSMIWELLYIYYILMYNS